MVVTSTDLSLEGFIQTLLGVFCVKRLLGCIVRARFLNLVFAATWAKLRLHNHSAWETHRH